MDGGEFVNSQDSLRDQLVRVMKLANEAGEYDAADWLYHQIKLMRVPGIRS